MSRSIPLCLHPVIVCEDRYGGTYSGGDWWAVAQADQLLDGLSRIAWLWKHGPGSDDVDAAIFWSDPPPWIVAASTPDTAIARLLANDQNNSDDWSPPPIENDLRFQSYFGTGQR